MAYTFFCNTQFEFGTGKVEALKDLPLPGSKALIVTTKDGFAAKYGHLARVQELLEKYEDVKPVRWHLIGHLQTNKVKQVIGKVVMIHSVDSLKLAREIDKRSAAAGIVTDILIEINSAMEETKSGIAASDLKQLVTEITEECSNVRVCGLMCIPPIAAEPEDSRPYFREAAELFKDMKSWELPSERFAPAELSMGMSGDFEVAIEEGATIVRVGSSIFGPRNYR